VASWWRHWPLRSWTSSPLSPSLENRPCLWASVTKKHNQLLQSHDPAPEAVPNLGPDVFPNIFTPSTRGTPGLLSPGRGASGRRGWTNRRLRMYWISSRGQPTRGGSTTWGLRGGEQPLSVKTAKSLSVTLGLQETSDLNWPKEGDMHLQCQQLVHTVFVSGRATYTAGCTQPASPAQTAAAQWLVGRVNTGAAGANSENGILPCPVSERGHQNTRYTQFLLLLGS
jgi:hypothetical protein